MPIRPLAPTPHCGGEFYATNNPYQRNGPRGFTESKYMEEETHDEYVKLDFPGVKKESVVVVVEPSEKTVVVTGDAPKESKHDSSHRKYTTTTGLICDCCLISNTQCFVEDGVVRLILSKKKINPLLPLFSSSDDDLGGLNPEGSRGTDPLDPAFTGPVIVPHPSVLEGSTSACESKRLRNGGLFLRIDMPGVPNDSFMVAVDSDGEVTVMAGAPATMHDSSGRHYVGKVATVPRGYDNSRIKIVPRHGVLRLIIPH